MGRGSRHSKNAGTMGSEAQTYNERSGQGYGTVRERLGKVAFLALTRYCSIPSFSWSNTALRVCRMRWAISTTAGLRSSLLWCDLLYSLVY